MHISVRTTARAVTNSSGWVSKFEHILSPSTAGHGDELDELANVEFFRWCELPIKDMPDKSNFHFALKSMLVDHLDLLEDLDANSQVRLVTDAPYIQMQLELKEQANEYYKAFYKSSFEDSAEYERLYNAKCRELVMAKETYGKKKSYRRFIAVEFEYSGFTLRFVCSQQKKLYSVKGSMGRFIPFRSLEQLLKMIRSGKSPDDWNKI